jgi:hypothetical protein
VQPARAGAVARPRRALGERRIGGGQRRAAERGIGRLLAPALVAPVVEIEQDGPGTIGARTSVERKAKPRPWAPSAAVTPSAAARP